MFVFLWVLIVLSSCLKVQHKLLYPVLSPTPPEKIEQVVSFKIDTTKFKVGETSERLAQELIILMDISGSMGGDKIEKSKDSVREIVEDMSDQDYFHLVTFSWGSEIVFESKMKRNQEEILKKVKSLRPNGATNMFAGLQSIEQILNRIKNRENTMKRIFLFSDGEVNAGETSSNVICEKVKYFDNLFSVTTSSFGIGNHFNEKLMMNLAEFGNGEYFYIKDSNDIEKVTRIAYRGFQQLMGKNGKFSLSPSSSPWSVKVLHAFGLDLEDNIVKFGDVRGGQEREVLVKLELDVPSTFSISSSSDPILLLEYEFTYYDVISKRQSYTRDQVTVSVSEDREKVTKSKDAGVENMSTLRKSVLIDQQAQKLIEEGQIERAREMKKKKQEALLHFSKTGAAKENVKFRKKLENVIRRGEAELEKDNSEEEFARMTTMNINLNAQDQDVYDEL